MVLLIGLQLGQLLRLGVYIDFEDHQTHTVGTLRTARLCAEEVQVVHFEEASARHDTEGLVPFGISQCIYTAQENITHRSCNHLRQKRVFILLVSFLIPIRTCYPVRQMATI
jgi:hypothetical protein